jgi:hypothetical protein
VKRTLLGVLACTLAVLICPPTASANETAASFEGDVVPVRSGADVTFYNGQNATVDEFPAIIAGLRAGGTRPQGQTCTGSVVAPRKIVIAAHCADAAGEKSFLYGLDDLNAGGGFRTNVVEYKKHPRYVNFDQGYDVAVVTTADDIPVRGGKYAAVATSKDAGLEAPGKNGLGFGYGKKDFDDASRDVTLDKATLPIVNGDQVCQGVGAGFKSATMVCAGYADGRTTILPGDSGGPLIVDGKIIGLASWSRSDFKWYSVYSRLTNDMGDWVATEVGQNPPGDGEFTVGLTPSSGKVEPGKYISATVTSKAGDQGAEKLDLSASGLPSGAKASFQPASINSGQNSKLTIETAASTPNGNHTITVSAAGPSGTKTATYTLTVGSGTGDLTLTVTPNTGTSGPGGFLTATVKVEGGSGPVTLDATGVQFKPFFNPQTVSPGGSSQITIIAPFQRGTFPITITGGSAKTTYTLTVR